MGLLGAIYQMIKNLLDKKPEWGSPTAGDTTPATTGAWNNLINLTITNPSVIAITVDVDAAGVGDSGVITVEQKVDGTNWKVTHNIQYDDVDINTIDDGATTADATAPKRAHQWVIYVDAGTDVRARVYQSGGTHIIYHNYNIKDEV